MIKICRIDSLACARLIDEAINSSSFQALIGKVRTHRKLEQFVAFCISGNLIVTTTIDSSLESAGCGAKTGWCMPLTASLAALVKRAYLAKVLTRE